MTQLHKHLSDFVFFSHYTTHACGYERRVYEVAFKTIDSAISDFMEKHGQTVLPIKQYNSEGNSANANHHEILNDLSLLRDKSTKLESELKLSYHIPSTDPSSADLYGMDVHMQFYLLPPDTVQGPEGKYFSKMVVIHIDDLENHEFVLG